MYDLTPGYFTPDSPEAIQSVKLLNNAWNAPWTDSEKETLMKWLENPDFYRHWVFLFQGSGEQWHQENYNFFNKLTNQP